MKPFLKEEQKLKNKVQSISSDLEEITKQRDSLLDKIEDLEDTIMKYEEVLDNKVSSGEGCAEIQTSRLELELESKEKRIRELKDTLGYIRKEKLELQRELELERKQNHKGKVFRIEEEQKSPLDLLAKELQDKIHKQEIEIRKLKQDNQKVEKLILKLKEREEEISLLKQNTLGINSTDQESHSHISRNLTQELQEKLNKAKIEISELRNQFSFYKDRDEYVKYLKNTEDEELSIDYLRNLVHEKNIQINNLKERIDSLEKSQGNSSGTETGGGGYSSNLVIDLQNQLRKAKLQIDTLQQKIRDSKTFGEKVNLSKKEEISGTIEEYKRKLKDLNQVIDEQELKIETKEEKLGKLNKKLNRLAISNKDLEQKLVLKSQQMDILEGHNKSSRRGKSTNSALGADPELAIRIKELENYLDELKSENESQRVEILKLKKQRS